MAEADKQLRVKIVTEAELAAAKAAEKSLQDVSKAAGQQAAPSLEKAADAAKKAGEGMGAAAQGIKQVTDSGQTAGAVIGGLWQGFRRLTNLLPGLGMAGVIGLVVAGIREMIGAMRDQDTQVGLTRQEMQELKSTTDSVATAKARFAESVRRAISGQRNAATWLDEENDKLAEQLQLTLDLARAQRDLEMAKINAAEIRGDLSGAQALEQRTAIEMAYSEFTTESQLSYNERLIANRRKAIEMARQEMEERMALAQKARELANQARMDAASKALQAARAASPDPNEGRDLGHGGWLINLMGWPHRVAIERAQKEQKALTEVGARRAAERAQRAAEEAARRESEAQEAAGRYGGLIGSGEIDRLNYRSAGLKQRRAIERETQVAEYMAELEAEKAKAREQIRRFAEEARKDTWAYRDAADALAKKNDAEQRLRELERQQNRARRILPGE